MKKQTIRISISFDVDVNIDSIEKAKKIALESIYGQSGSGCSTENGSYDWRVLNDSKKIIKVKIL